MIIKVCGMRVPDNITEIRSLDIDWMGLIFYAGSPRYVTQGLEQVSFNGLVRVGVFVDAAMADIRDRVFRYGLNMIQLHGDESPEKCREVKSLGMQVVKAIPVAEREDLQLALRYEPVADYLLLDTKTKVKGGSGKKFDWQILEDYSAKTPFLLSGGISPGDARAIANIDHPMMAGVDLNSQFETAPGLKNVELVKQFVSELRKEIHEV